MLVQFLLKTRNKKWHAKAIVSRGMREHKIHLLLSFFFYHLANSNDNIKYV